MSVPVENPGGLSFFVARIKASIVKVLPCGLCYVISRGVIKNVKELAKP